MIRGCWRSLVDRRKIDKLSPPPLQFFFRSFVLEKKERERELQNSEVVTLSRPQYLSFRFVSFWFRFFFYSPPWNFLVDLTGSVWWRGWRGMQWNGSSDSGKMNNLDSGCSTCSNCSVFALDFLLFFFFFFTFTFPAIFINSFFFLFVFIILFSFFQQALSSSSLA